MERQNPENTAADVSTPFVQPYSGLGRLTMREYADRYNADLERVLAILKERGLDLDPDEKLKDEAGRFGIDPEGIIEMLNQSVAGEET